MDSLVRLWVDCLHVLMYGCVAHHIFIAFDTDYMKNVNITKREEKVFYRNYKYI